MKNKVIPYLFYSAIFFSFIVSLLVFNNNYKIAELNPDSYSADLKELKSILPPGSTISCVCEGRDIYSLFSLRNYLHPVLVLDHKFQQADTLLFISFLGNNQPEHGGKIIWEKQGKLAHYYLSEKRKH